MIEDNNIAGKKFALGYWITSHRKQIKIAYTVLIGLIAAAMMAMAIYHLIDWITHIGPTREVIQSLATNDIKHDSIKPPEDIQRVKSTSVRRDAEKIDIVAQLVNPNNIWAAIDVEYEVFIGSLSVGIEHITLAPLQEKYITKTQLPYTEEDLPSVNVTILDTTWKKMVKHENLPDAEWEFVDADFGYINAIEANVSYQTKLTFTLKNKSIYGFRDARIVVLLVDDMQEIHGIGNLPLDEITSLESRPVSFLWPRRLSSSLTPKIHINIDKLSEDLIIRKLK